MAAAIKRRGGATIGWTASGYVKLTATANEIIVSDLVLGSYSFSPSDVVSLEPYGSVPVFGRGIRIIHTKADYPEKVIFRSFGDPDRLIKQIGDVGFRPSASPASVPRREGIPFRWSFLIALVVMWNALFVLDGFVPWKEPKAPGPYVLVALLLLFLTASALRRPSGLQSLALKPGRAVCEVRPTVLLVQLVSLFLLIMSIVHHLAS